MLEDNNDNGCLVGNHVTIADLFLYHLVAWLDGGLDGGLLDGELRAIDSSVLDEYPLLRQHNEAIERNPAVVNFREQHKSPYLTFDFVPQDSAPGVSEGKRADSRPARVKRMPSSDGLPRNEKRSGNRLRGARRIPSNDGLPRNVARSKSSDGISAPFPAKRRESLRENDDAFSNQAKEADTMMKAPLRRKASFDYVADDDFGPGRKARGASMPPRARPVIIDDDEDDNVNFSDESDNSTDLNESYASLLAGDQQFTHSPTFGRSKFTNSPLRKKRDEFWDDSSTSSFGDGTSLSSVEHDLAALNMRVEVKREEERASLSDPVASHEKDDAIQRKKRRTKKKPAPGTTRKIAPPRLPVNAPRHVPPKRKKAIVTKKVDVVKASPAKATRNLKDKTSTEGSSHSVDANSKELPESATTRGKSREQTQLPPTLPTSDQLSSTLTGILSKRESTPTKNRKKVKRLSSNDQRIKFPSNSPRGPGRAASKGKY